MWGLTDSCLAMQTGDAGGVCVDVLKEFRGEWRNTACGCQGVFMRACILIAAHSMKQALVSGTAPLNNLFH